MFLTDKSRDFPIEYKKGVVKFLNCKIDLSKRPFIPRIETEYWVKKAIGDVRMLECSNVGMLKILDMFAGSGCIGIAILKNIKNSTCDFGEIDENSLEQIRTNLKINKIERGRARVIKTNIFSNIKRKYDYIFANPPYVAEERIKEVQPEVLKYEPKKALLAGPAGLFYIRKLLSEAKNFFKKEGMIYLEIDPRQKEEIKKILEKENYSKFQFLKDQFKKYRWVKIRN